MQIESRIETIEIKKLFGKLEKEFEAISLKHARKTCAKKRTYLKNIHSTSRQGRIFHKSLQLMKTTSGNESSKKH